MHVPPAIFDASFSKFVKGAAYGVIDTNEAAALGNLAAHLDPELQTCRVQPRRGRARQESFGDFVTGYNKANADIERVSELVELVNGLKAIG